MSRPRGDNIAPGPGAESSDPASAAEPLRLVTLGDAYTAGTDTGAPKRDSWPAQLVQAMERGDVRLRLVDNLADSGQTSEYVLDEQLPQVESLHPDVVTVQVGVNDIVARRQFEDYDRNVTRILDELLLILPPERIFVITTPDHTLTERGGDYGARGSPAVRRSVRPMPSSGLWRRSAASRSSISRR